MTQTIRRIDKPWGYEDIWVETDKYVGKTLVIYPGHRLSKQFHKIKDETLYVETGLPHIEIYNEDGSLREIQIPSPGSAVRIPTGTIHRIVAGDFLCRLIEVSTPEIWDVERLSDDYGRAVGKVDSLT